ncbi:MAG: DoxX family protein [Myxococcota bacterium]
MDILPLAFFVAVPVVILTTAFMYFLRKGRQEDPSDSREEGSRSKVTWAVTALLALVFAGAGFPKVGSMDMVLTSFEQWGYPESFHYVVGGIEFIAAILLLIPSTATLSALLLAGIMVGAFVTHATAGEYAMLPVNVVLFAGLAYVAWARSKEMFGKGNDSTEKAAA